MSKLTLTNCRQAIEALIAAYVAVHPDSALVQVPVVIERTSVSLRKEIDPTLEKQGIVIVLAWPSVPAGTTTVKSVSFTVRCEVSVLHNPKALFAAAGLNRDPLAVLQDLLAALAGQPDNASQLNLEFTGGLLGPMEQVPGAYTQSLFVNFKARIN